MGWETKNTCRWSILLVISVPKIFVNGQFYFNLSSKMWSHVFLEHSVVLLRNMFAYTDPLVPDVFVWMSCELKGYRDAVIVIVIIYYIAIEQNARDATLSGSLSISLIIAKLITTIQSHTDLHVFSVSRIRTNMIVIRGHVIS